MSLLVMRKGFGWHADHIQTLRSFPDPVHLVTEVSGAESDGRFASVTVVPHGQDVDETVAQLVRLARRIGVDHVLTFAETDIVVAGRANAELGCAWARPEADEIARDKRRQREFLAAEGVPSVRFAPVASVAEAARAAEGVGYPLIVKPTHAASSRGVALVSDAPSLERELRRIEALAGSTEGNYFTGREQTFALLEEFLPGVEVTLDGIVLHGRFHLAGVTNKMQMPGPYFEEDLYTLPYRDLARERELAEIATAIASGLRLEHALFNVELRQDAHGRFRVVEFSTRMSGGQNYRNLREAHGIDVVRLYVKALRCPDAASVWRGETPRLRPRRATCIKYAYRTGTVLRNVPGEVALSPFFQSYIAVAKPGARLARAPERYDVAGSLSVAAAYRSPADVDRIEAIAEELDRRLDILVVPPPVAPREQPDSAAAQGRVRQLVS
jgi:biotin carboxylase